MLTAQNLLTAALLTLLVLPASAKTSPEQQVEAVSRLRLAALVSHDMTGFAKYYTPDFDLTLDNGKRTDIGFLTRWTSHDTTHFTLVPSEYTVVASPDGQMAFTEFEMTETYPDPKGGPADVEHTVFTEVYVKQQGQWKVRHEQYATKPNPPAAPITR